VGDTYLRNQVATVATGRQGGRRYEEVRPRPNPTFSRAEVMQNCRRPLNGIRDTASASPTMIAATASKSWP
jgi:hypothetical protein